MVMAATRSTGRENIAFYLLVFSEGSLLIRSLFTRNQFKRTTSRDAVANQCLLEYLLVIDLNQSAYCSEKSMD